MGKPVVVEILVRTNEGYTEFKNWYDVVLGVTNFRVEADGAVFIDGKYVGEFVQIGGITSE